MTSLYDLNSIVDVYRNVLGTDLLRYVLGAGGVYLLINVALAQRLRHRKIRDGAPPGGQIRREILASLRTVAIFAANGTGIVLGAELGVFTIYEDIAEYGTAYFWFSVTALIVLHDAWFYWSHRLLHYPPVFRLCHRLHHRSHQPTPFTSYSFDAGEAVINAVYLPLALLILPAHPLALMIFVMHMMLRNVIGHCGYEVFPARRDGRPLMGWLTTVTHHDLHHAHAGYNLGLYFTWWDRLMDTEHPGYHAAFAKVGRPLGRAGITAAAIVVATLGLMAGRADAADLHGSYAAPGMAVVVRFAPCADNARNRCGTLVWMWDKTATPHGRIGDVIIRDMRYDGSHWRGRLKSPESGWTFRGTIQPRGADRLHLRGCAGPVCASQTWHSIRSLRSALKSLR